VKYSETLFDCILKTLIMPIIIQLYILTTFGFIVLSRSLKDFLSDKLLRSVCFLLVYAGILRVLLGLNPQLPLFFHESVFLAFALFVPGSYLCLRNFVYNRRLKEKDVVHVVPFLTLVICSLTVSFLGTTFQLEVKKIWSFNSEPSYDSNILMPLFLFIYCLTAFYFYRILLLFKNTLLKKEHTVQQDDWLKQPLNDDNFEKAESQHQPLVISPERMVEIDQIVKEVFSEKKPYLQQRYSLKDLAIDTNIPLHYLSAFINKYWGKNFNDFINEFRVHHCKDKILNEEYKFKKLEAIAEESGFNNRNTFAIAFKKVTGLKPSEYLKNLKAENHENKKIYNLDPQGYLQRV
jgi:AraC-like DNA-binding protein